MPPTTQQHDRDVDQRDPHAEAGAREVSSCSRSMNAWMRESMQQWRLSDLLYPVRHSTSVLIDQRDDREQRQQRGHGEGADEVVLVV